MVETYISAEWLKPIEESLRKSRKRGASQGSQIDAILRDPESFLRNYVEPRCRYKDHTDNNGKEPCLAFDAINLFLGNGVDPSKAGGRQMLVLGDSGTGKTSLLTMLKLAHATEHRPVPYRCEFISLGQDAIGKIKLIEKEMETVILLDGLDEDPLAKGNARQRLLELLEATRGFLRVFISCQNRYFLQNIKNPELDEEEGKIGEFDCPTMMLLDFDEDQVSAYLEKRFKRNWKDKIARRAKSELAYSRVESMGKLRFRPQMLSLIEDLMKSDEPANDEYSIIETAVIQWLIREEEAHEKENLNVSIESLYNAVKQIALLMVKEGLESIPENIAIESFISIQNNIPLRAVEFLPSALLHRFRDQAGQTHYRFIHQTFRDFLAVQSIFDSSDEKEIVVPDFATNKMIDFIVKGRGMDEDLKDKKLIMRDLQLSTFGFEAADLKGAVIEGADLRNANFQDADLSEVNFKKCLLEGARFDQAITTGAIPDTPTVGLPVSFGIDEDVFLDMLWVEPGSFTIGHRKSPIVVEIKEGYWLGQFPVTQRVFQSIMEFNPSFFKSDSEKDLPVEQVSWYDAQRFCQELNSLIPDDLDDDYQFRLPGEIEWVYACRAGTNTMFSYGDGEEHLSKFGWYAANSNAQTHKVGSKKPNPWGFYDMHGNVWEWCKDRNDDFFTSILTDMVNSDASKVRAVRGGCWSNNPYACRTANRNWYSPDANSSSIGFRVALFRQPKSEIQKEKIEKKQLGL